MTDTDALILLTAVGVIIWLLALYSKGERK